MNDANKNTESFNEIKIIKPKVVRLCPSRKIKKSPSSSSTSSSNSSHSIKSQNQFIQSDSKNIFINLDNISIEEINNDFCNYQNNFEEEECQNEILNILNNDIELDNENIPKIKRCKNPYKKNIELMKDSYFTNCLKELNELNLNQME